MDKDLISINIVAFNAEKTLARTLDSAFAQQGVTFEIVFVNDASTDKTLEIANEYKSAHPSVPFTILTNSSNLGITKSRNIALKASKGSYIAVIDSDDTWTSPQKLALQLAVLRQHSECVVVGTQMRLVRQDRTAIKQTSYETTDADIRRQMLVFNQFCHSSVLMRNVGQTYDDSLFIWEDHDLLLSLGLKGTFANIDQTLVDYLYVPKKYSFSKKLKLIRTEFEIISRYKMKYPNYWVGYFKRVLKLILTLLHLK